jgi:hypothetical protein
MEVTREVQGSPGPCPLNSTSPQLRSHRAVHDRGRAFLWNGC